MAAGAAFLLVLLPGCRLVEPPAPPPAAVAIVAEGPALLPGARDAEADRETARLLQEGEAELAAGRHAQARVLASEIITRYPGGAGSSMALLLRARAARGLGEWADADGALADFLRLVPVTDPAGADALVLRADVRWEGGMGGYLETLFQLPADAPAGVLARAEELATDWAGTLETAALRDLVDEAPPHPRLLPVFQAELAVRRYLAGAQAEARSIAEAALALAPGGSTAERAREVLEGRVVEGAAVAAVIGSILPASGPPSVMQMATEIREGIEVALQVEERGGAGSIRLLTVVDPGTPEGLRAALDELAREGATGIVGPLEEPGLDALARAGTGLPLLSPTARMVPEGVGPAFSLAGVDPEAGRALAGLVLREGIRDVIVFHPSTREMAEEARWFSEAYRAGGGTILRTLTYAPGTTGFASQMQEILRTGPRGLVLLLPQADVATVAPQLSFYGVDEIDTLVRFGNESWTSPAVIQGMQPRHTEGVLAVTSWLGNGAFGPGWEDFVAAYEGHFRRTLRSAVPALGYDSARLLLHAARLGGGTPQGTLRAFQEIRDFPGATGFLSVVDGRVRRSYQPVRIQNRTVLPHTP